MGDLPQVIDASYPRPLHVPEASPRAFGSDVGGAVQNTGAELGAVAAHERQMAAAFDAQDRELKYGEANDKLEESFKNDLRTMSAPDDESYQRLVSARLQRLSAEREQLRARFESSLGDPIARKSYAIRTRLQTQMADRQALLFADKHIQTWRDQTSEGLISYHTEQAGNVSGVDASADLLHFEAATGLAHDAFDKANPGIAPEFALGKKHEIDQKAALRALSTYVQTDNYAAGMAFLAGKLGDGTRVGYDKDHPNDPSILTSDQVAKWRAQFSDAQSTKIAAGLGEQLYQESKTVKGFNLEARLTEIYKKGDVPPEAISKARQQFNGIVKEHHQLHEIALGQTLESLYNVVTQKYDGNIDRAIAADPKIKGAWVGLSVEQPRLRAMLKKEDKADPTATLGIGQLYDEARVPGWAAKYGSYPAFLAKWGPAVGGAYMDEARKMYEADVKRDTSTDSSRASFNQQAELRLRTIVDLRDSWNFAKPEQNRAKIDYLQRVEQAWLAHEAARKETPNKMTDLSWENNALNEISQAVQKNWSRKVYENEKYTTNVPGPTPPAAARTAPAHAQGPQPGDVVPSEQLGYEPGGKIKILPNGGHMRVE